MARIVIPTANWQPKLHQALGHLKDGDVLIVPRREAEQFAMREINRRYPDLFIIIEERDE